MIKKKYRDGEIDANAFRLLPERAQEIWFQYCHQAILERKYENIMAMDVIGFDYRECKSPIEVIFNFAFDLVAFSEGCCGFWLTPQYEVKSDKKQYFIDFAFITEDIEEICHIKNPSFKLAIECDGHEFHEKTKEQVANDNEREYDLKMMGYDVLRFSGSQIYNKPFRCATQTLHYIIEKLGVEKDVRD